MITFKLTIIDDDGKENFVLCRRLAPDDATSAAIKSLVNSPELQKFMIVPTVVK